MNHIEESIVIGEHVAELVKRGVAFSLIPNASPASPPKVRLYPNEQIIAKNGRKTPKPLHRPRDFASGSFVERLRAAVNDVRNKAGEASVESEAGKAVAADEAHVAQGIVETGPNAACSCGSQADLCIERPVKVFRSWITGKVRFDPIFGTMGIAGQPHPGEIGTCFGCGRHYTFGPL
jgi:hypothetical protein